MKPIRILVDSFADAGFPNAQMGNAREIVSRLDPQRFHVSMFALGTVDPRIAQRPNTRLIRLPKQEAVLLLEDSIYTPEGTIGSSMQGVSYTVSYFS